MQSSCATGRALQASVLRLWILSASLAVLASCGSDANSPPAHAPNHVRLHSDPGDFLGGGAEYDYTQANAIIKASTSDGVFTLSISGDENWDGEFDMPAGMPLKVGTYPARYPALYADQASLDWSGRAGACNSTTGSFTIDTVEYSGVALSQIDLSFEQHCEGVSPALRGTIHWRYDDMTANPGPVTPIPTNLWKPDPSVLPTAARYVYLSSDPGEYVGGGTTSTVAAPSGSVALTATGGHVSIAAGPWLGDVRTMSSVSEIRVGYYPDVHTGNPVKGSVSWEGNGRGCSVMTGWFAVDKAVYSGTALTALDLRFEGHCDGETPALHGAIHWTKP